MKALVIQTPGVVEVKEVKEPSPRPGYIKVKVVAVALNPTDWHHADSLGQPGGIIGCDYSGTVVEVGEDCIGDMKPGDAIFGVVHGANMSQVEDGAFAEYCMQKSGLCGNIPEGMTFEDASTFGAALTSVGQGLYETLGIPPFSYPSSKPYPVLIYGGSTSQGSLAIQCAKLSGLTVVATASPENFEFVKSRGADAVFDYHDADCAAKIRDWTQNGLRHVFDTIGRPETAKICAEAMASSANRGKLRYTSSQQIETFPRKDVANTTFLVYTAIGEAFEKRGRIYPSKPERYEFATAFWEAVVALIHEGKLVPHPVQTNDGGLAGIPAGLQLLRENKMTAKKLVYRVSDTPNI